MHHLTARTRTLVLFSILIVEIMAVTTAALLAPDHAWYALAHPYRSSQLIPSPERIVGVLLVVVMLAWIIIALSRSAHRGHHILGAGVVASPLALWTLSIFFSHSTYKDYGPVVGGGLITDMPGGEYVTGWPLTYARDVTGGIAGMDRTVLRSAFVVDYLLAFLLTWIALAILVAIVRRVRRVRAP